MDPHVTRPSVGEHVAIDVEFNAEFTPQPGPEITPTPAGHESVATGIVPLHGSRSSNMTHRENRFHGFFFYFDGNGARDCSLAQLSVIDIAP